MIPNNIIYTLFVSVLFLHIITFIIYYYIEYLLFIIYWKIKFIKPIRIMKLRCKFIIYIQYRIFNLYSNGHNVAIAYNL